MNITGTSVSTAAMNAVLAHFAKEAGAGPKIQVVLVLDGAGWHSSKGLLVPEGVHLVFLPAYSPELQPAERLWPIINEAVANREWSSFDDLLAAVRARCHHLDVNRELVSRLTLYHWWPADHRNEIES